MCPTVGTLASRLWGICSPTAGRWCLGPPEVGRTTRPRPAGATGRVKGARDPRAMCPTVGTLASRLWGICSPTVRLGIRCRPKGGTCATVGDGPGAFNGACLPATCHLPGTPASRLRGAPRTVFYAAESEGPWTSCAGQSRSARSWPGPCWTASDTGAGPGAGTDARFSERRVAPLA